MPHDALLGAILDGRYQVIEPIAKGAMGTVYRGERLGLGRAVAIKMMHEKLPSEMASRKRFEVEAKAMAQLEHPHCVPVFDVGVHEGKPYIVMELVRGKNLKDLIVEGTFTRARAVSIVKQILSGLSHAHELGIVHRDIKPPNIVVSQKSGIGEHVRILDFGLARWNVHATGLTAGFAVGTPAYMAPEQCVGQTVTPRTDLYAVGVVLFELLVGRRPFEHDDPLEIVRMHISQPPPRLRDIRDEDFGSLEAIVARALEKNAADRFDDANEMAAALEELAGPHVTGPVKAILPTPTSARILDPNDVSSIPLDTDDIVASAPIQYPSTLPGFEPPVTNKTPVAGTTALAVDPAEPAADPADSEPRFLAAPPAVAPAPPPTDRSSVMDQSGPVVVAHGISGRRVVLAILLLAILAAGAGLVFASGWLSPNKPRTPPTALAPPDPGIPIAAQAATLAAQGKLDAAIEQVANARKIHATSPALAYRAGRLYCQREAWTDCLLAFRDAIRLEPGYRHDVDLIRDVLRGFIVAVDPAPLAKFLREDIGAPATPFLDETARTHPNPKVRARAQAALR
ncbi:MAG TPA: serine/threonine-protein kinase [Kofleriaceae bacterium]|nr:serine/threonine-protein kinase [Kofleriaceae bacterium]